MEDQKLSEGKEPSEMEEFKTFMEALTPAVSKALEEILKHQREQWAAQAKEFGEQRSIYRQEIESRERLERERISGQKENDSKLADKISGLVTQRHWLAGVTILSLVAASAYLLAHDKEITSMVSIGFGILSLILGTSPRKKDD